MSVPQTAPLGFIGVGLMGLPMTLRLLDAGRTVHVFNRTRAKLAPVLAAGAKEAASPAAVAASAAIVFMCVTDTAAAEAVLFGANGIAGGAAPDTIVVDFSSISPDTTRQFVARLGERGIALVDVPVSGGTAGAEAEAGTLAIMAGGTADDVEAVRDTVMLMAARFTHMGPSGAGQITKLCNQVIVGTQMAVLAEAARLALDAGIDATRLPEALHGGFADSKPLQLFVPRMLEARHDPPLGHAYTMLKDLDEVRALAKQTGPPVPMTAEAAELFRLLTKRAGPHADALEIFKLSAATPLD